MTATRESTLALINKYREKHGEWPSMDDLRQFASANRVRNKLASRVDGLVRGGHVTINETGRIVRATGTTPTKTM